VTASAHPILIADDHDLYREALAMLISKSFPQHESCQANNFSQLLTVAQQQQDWFAFIIDLNMPDGDIDHTIKTLKIQHPKTPIIVISASERPEDTHKAMQHGILGYITKSMDNSEITQAIELMLKRGISIHPVTESQTTNKEIPLTPRQKEVLSRMCEGASNKRIALDMGLSESTVKIHVRAILSSLEVSNRTEAVIKAKAELLF
jgi:DNA-binding NarL/FixJ family response regulator